MFRHARCNCTIRVPAEIFLRRVDMHELSKTRIFCFAPMRQFTLAVTSSSVFVHEFTVVCATSNCSLGQSRDQAKSTCLILFVGYLRLCRMRSCRKLVAAVKSTPCRGGIPDMHEPSRSFFTPEFTEKSVYLVFMPTVTF